LIALVGLFVWVGFRGVDIVVVSLGSTLVALIGFVCAVFGKKAEGRRRGSTGSSALTLIGYWANLALFVVSSLLFAYSLAMGILRGEFI
jgi:hypothetical protein